MYDYIKSKTFIHLHLQSINRKVKQIRKNSHVVTLVLLCCRTTPSTKVPSRQLSAGNIKRTDSSRGRRSTFQSGSPSWSTMKQHPSPWTVVNRWDQLVCVGWWVGVGGLGARWMLMLMSNLLAFDLKHATLDCLSSILCCMHGTHTYSKSISPPS